MDDSIDSSLLLLYSMPLFIQIISMFKEEFPGNTIKQTPVGFLVRVYLRRFERQNLFHFNQQHIQLKERSDSVSQALVFSDKSLQLYSQQKWHGAH